MERKVIHMSNISPICLVNTLVKNLWMIVATVMIMAMGTSLHFQWFHAPVYQASMTYVVASRTTTYVTSGNLSATKELAAVMTELLESNVITDNIRSHSEELADFSGTIDAVQINNTNMVSVRCNASSPKEAFLALCALEELFPELSEYLSKNSVAQVLQNPAVSAFPINSVDINATMKKMGLVGAVIMAILLCWISIRRETVQTRSGARRLLDAPIIVTIGHEQKNRTLKAKITRSVKGLQVFAPTTSYAYSEQINTICTRLEKENEVNGSRIFLISGVGKNEGKSTVSGNVATMLAMKGKNVALVDADLRKPAMNLFFDGAYHSTMPLNKLLAEPYSRKNLMECMVQHPQLGLYMLFSTPVKNPSAKLLTGQTMQLLLQQLRVFDYVIIDTPPMGFFTDTEVLAENVDATMLVVRQDRTPACDINDAVDALRASKSKFLGCILNDMRGHIFGARRYGYG